MDTRGRLGSVPRNTRCHDPKSRAAHTGSGRHLRVRGFVLPHRDRFANEADFERAGGPEVGPANKVSMSIGRKGFCWRAGGLGSARDARGRVKRRAGWRGSGSTSPTPATRTGGSTFARPSHDLRTQSGSACRQSQTTSGGGHARYSFIAANTVPGHREPTCQGSG